MDNAPGHRSIQYVDSVSGHGSSRHVDNAPGHGNNGNVDSKIAEHTEVAYKSENPTKKSKVN